MSTLDCLASLSANVVSDVVVTIFLVDDGSSDGTAKAVREIYPTVHVDSGNGALYWGGGMRQAFANSLRMDPDYILWLNDDVVLAPDALERLLDAQIATGLHQQSTALIVGATSDQIHGGTSYGGLRQSPSRIRRMSFTTIEPGTKPQRCDTMNGNIVLIPRSVYTVTGSNDARFTHSMGDIDYGLRARAAGFEVILAAGHLGTCSPNTSTGTHRDPTLSRLERLRRANSVKGVPIREWAALCRRHGGPLWPALALSPYVRVLTGWPR